MTFDTLEEAAEAIRDKAAALTEPCGEFLRDMIRIPAESLREKERAARIIEEMKSVGFDSAELDGLGSTVGRYGAGGPTIAFDGHIDQVGVGDPGAWTVEPHAAVLRDGIIYGRGASDQLGGVAAAVYGGRILAELGVRGDWTYVAVGSVIEEDCDGLCWRHLIDEHGLRPDVVVLTEPTSLRINRGQRGRIELKVVTKGRSCHASMPQLGDNAIYKMAPIVTEIEELAGQLPEDEFLGKGSLVVSKIESTSPSLNAVADSCTVYLDRRVIPGDTEESTKGEILGLAAAQRAGAEVEVLQYEAEAYTGKRYGQTKFFPAWALDAGHELVQAGEESARLVTGRDAEVSRWEFSTNGVATMGIYGIPSIGYGPGDEEHAHTPQDQIRVADLTSAMAFYAMLPLVWQARSR